MNRIFNLLFILCFSVCHVSAQVEQYVARDVTESAENKNEEAFDKLKVEESKKEEAFDKLKVEESKKEEAFNQLKHAVDTFYGNFDGYITRSKQAFQDYINERKENGDFESYVVDGEEKNIISPGLNPAQIEGKNDLFVPIAHYSERDTVYTDLEQAKQKFSPDQLLRMAADVKKANNDLSEAWFRDEYLKRDVNSMELITTPDSGRYVSKDIPIDHFVVRKCKVAQQIIQNILLNEGMSDAIEKEIEEINAETFWHTNLVQLLNQDLQSGKPVLEEGHYEMKHKKAEEKKKEKEALIETIITTFRELFTEYSGLSLMSYSIEDFEDNIIKKIQSNKEDHKIKYYNDSLKHFIDFTHKVREFLPTENSYEYGSDELLDRLYEHIIDYVDNIFDRNKCARISEQVDKTLAALMQRKENNK